MSVPKYLNDISFQTSKTVSIFGVTGSIGLSCINIIEQHPSLFAVETVVAHSQVEALAQAAIRVNAKYAIIVDETKYEDLKQALSGTEVKAFAGSQARDDHSKASVDLHVAAIVGDAGLCSTYYAIQNAKQVALANKESLVCSGGILMSLAQKNGTVILPMDSEHNALFQALLGQDQQRLEKITITASGGPFFGKTHSELNNILPKDALKHPNWDMGAKVTIDSATLMNKGLEVIEAGRLFHLDPDLIHVVVHPQSIIHSFVHYLDGSVLAQLGMPDMRIPISMCLGWPQRLEIDVPKLDLLKMGDLTFHQPDRKSFKCLALAEQALRSGDVATCCLNTANEVAVSQFLRQSRSFLSIPELCENVMDKFSSEKQFSSIDDVYELINQARQYALTQ